MVGKDADVLTSPITLSITRKIKIIRTKEIAEPAHELNLLPRNFSSMIFFE